MTISLNELAHPEITVTVRGKVYDVAPIDGFAKQLTDKATPENSYEIMCKVAARCLGVPFAEVFGAEDKIGFSPSEVMKVVDAATKQVAAVEATLPNDGKAGAETGEAKTPLPSESPQPIQLAS